MRLVLDTNTAISALLWHGAPSKLIAQYTGLAETILAAPIAAVVLADPDDDHVLACALAAGADLIVSGYAHLLNHRERECAAAQDHQDTRPFPVRRGREQTDLAGAPKHHRLVEPRGTRPEGGNEPIRHPLPRPLHAAASVKSFNSDFPTTSVVRRKRRTPPLKSLSPASRTEFRTLPAAMADAFTYHFDWDPAKAAENIAKHGVSFRLATSVFRDALALTVYDDEHSQTEERWATIGHAENGVTLVVIHTHEVLAANEARMRIISARTADRSEIDDYENTPR